MNYWVDNEEMKNIAPKGAMPEPIEYALWLRERVADKHVADVGCGYGRLSPLFDNSKYIGYDVNEHAIKEAKRLHPEKCFAKMPLLIQSEAVLLHTVMLHLRMMNAQEMLDKIIADTIIISEIMSPELANLTLEPCCYNREPKVYEAMLAKKDFHLVESAEFTYGCDRYGPQYKLNSLLFLR